MMREVDGDGGGGGGNPRGMMCWCYMVSGEIGRWRSEVNGMRRREEKRSRAR